MDAILFSGAVIACVVAFSFGVFRAQVTAERWLLSSSLTVLLLALTSLLAVRLHIYSVRLAGGALLGFAAIAWLPRFRAPLTGPQGREVDERGGWAIAALLVPLGALYALFPTYFVLGGQDPGIYLMYAARIASTGALDLDLPWLRDIAQAHPHGLALGYPGVYSYVHSSVGTDPTRLSPQFAHLFPALAANAWSLGGLEAAVRVNAIVGVLTVWTAFVLVRRLAGVGPALAGAGVIGVNPAIVWEARITLTELTAAWLNLLTLLLFVIATDRRGTRIWAITGAAVLGMGILNRLDAGVSALALLGLAIGGILAPELKAAIRSAALTYLGVSVLSFIDVARASPFYVQTLIQQQHLSLLIAGFTGTGILSYALGRCPDRILARLLPPPLLGRILREAFRLLVIWVVIALFAWPAVDASASARNARELSWYVSAVAWPLTLLGLGLFLRNLSPRHLPLLALASGALVLFTAESQVVPLHIWASRRWVPQVIPSMAVVSVFAASYLVTSARRFRIPRWLVAPALLAAYCVPAVELSRPFLLRSMLHGLPEAYGALLERLHAAHVEPPLVTTNPHLGSVLTYVYGVPTVLVGGRTEYGLQDAEARDVLGRGELAGMRSVGIEAPELGSVPVASALFRGEYLEQVEARRPRTLAAWPVALDVGVVGGPKFEWDVPLFGPRFPSEVGELQPNGALRTTGRAGYLQGGPCVTIASGQYEVDWIGRVVSERPPGEASGRVEVFAPRLGVIADGEVRARPEGGSDTWLAGLDFSLPDPAECAELRFRVEAGVALLLSRLRLRRIGPSPAARDMSP